MLHPHQADEHPLATGEPLRKWQRRQITEQCEAFLKTLKEPLGKDQAWFKKTVATPRDNYGWKSL